MKKLRSWPSICIVVTRATTWKWGKGHEPSQLAVGRAVDPTPFKSSCGTKILVINFPQKHLVIVYLRWGPWKGGKVNILLKMEGFSCLTLTYNKGFVIQPWNIFEMSCPFFYYSYGIFTRMRQFPDKILTTVVNFVSISEKLLIAIRLINVLTFTYQNLLNRTKLER